MQDYVGKTLGQYEIKAEVGHGGMAVVYRGYQASLNRSVAVKVLSSELARDADFRARFQREAVAVAQLAHPNILPVYDFGQDADTGALYFVTQFVDGGSLAQRMGTPTPPREAARIAAQIARALDCAHSRGIIHRDVKPANVLMTGEGHSLLSDFGIAKIMAETRLTQTGASLGTPSYMSPEQAQGLPVDHHSDIYALGVVLYEMLAGVLPFNADTPVALLHQHVSSPPPPLRERVQGVSRGLDKIVMTALAKDPLDRFETAGEMAEALEAEAAGERKPFGLVRRAAKPVPTPVPMVSPARPGAATEVAEAAAGIRTVAPEAVPTFTPPRRSTPVQRTWARFTRTVAPKMGKAAGDVGRWALRTVGGTLVVLVIVAIILLLGAALALGAVAERSIANQPWMFKDAGPGFRERVICADLAANVSQAVEPYVLDALTDVEAECQAPDTIALRGRFRGGPISTQVQVRVKDGVPAIRLERLNNVPLYVVGGIVSDGVNRGLVKAWAKSPVWIDTLTVSADSIDLLYKANPNAP